MNKKRIIANLLIMGTGQIATWLLSFLAVVLASRYFGPRIVGEANLAGSVVAVLGLMVTLGMDTLLTRSVARSPEQAGRLASAAVLARSALAIPMLCVLIAYTTIARFDPEVRELAYIMAGGMIIGALAGAWVAVFQGHERMSLGTITQTLGNLLDLLVVALVVWLHGSVVLYVGLGIPIHILLLLLNLRWARRYAPLTLHISIHDLRAVVVGSLPFLARGMFLTIYIAIDAIILGSLEGTRPVGVYAAASRFLAVALFLPGLVSAATLPLLSRRGIDAGTDFVRAGREVLSLLVACAVPLTVGLATFAGPLIAVVYGPAFQPAGPVLVVLSLCILPTFLSIQGAQTLAACDQTWRWTLVMAASCVINPLINLWLIPFAAQRWQNAALGAALALLATESLMAVYAIVSLRPMFLSARFGRVVLASLVAGAAQLLIIWVTTPVWAPFAEALGLIAYVALALYWEVVPRGDVALVWRAVQVRLRPRVPVQQVGDTSA